MLKLVVFDCDGVMFDTKNLNLHYYNHLLEHFGHPAMSVAELEYVHAHNVADSVAHIFKKYSVPSIDEVHELRQTLDYSSFLHHMTMEEDLVFFLDTIRDRYHLAISTNRSDTMDILLETFGLTEYFGKVMTAANAKRPKPAADGMLEILEHYNCKAAETIYIGDTIVDQLHAEYSCVPLIAFRNKTLQAAYHVNTFTEILALPPFKAR